MCAKCIYCLCSKELDLFDKEHVIPESFGGFKHALTLVHVVCKCCNQYFGNSLDLFLARDSWEGLLRHKYGIGMTDEPKLIYRRTLVRVEEEGEWKNAFLQITISEDGSELQVEPIDQVGFRKEDPSEWTFFPLDKLPKKAELEMQGFVMRGLKTVKMLYSPGNCNVERMQNALIENGIILDSEMTEDIKWSHAGQSINVAIYATIDAYIFRAIAKIAFNYLAKIAGSAFVLDEAFSEIRSFVRYGVGAAGDFVRVEDAPILKEEQIYGMTQTRGHLVTIAWGVADSLISRVSLFNDRTYKVRLCRRFKGLWRQIGSGHHYDIDSMEVSRLIHAPSRLSPW